MCDDEDDAFNHIESMNRVKKAFDEDMAKQRMFEKTFYQVVRNQTIEEIAREFDAMKSGGDTTASFAIFVRAMKK